MNFARLIVMAVSSSVVPIEGFAEVRTGALLVARTLMVNCCWAVFPARSVAWTVTCSVGVWSAVGVQLIRPVSLTMVIPAGG